MAAATSLYAPSEVACSHAVSEPSVASSSACRPRRSATGTAAPARRSAIAAAIAAFVEAPASHTRKGFRVYSARSQRLAVSSRKRCCAVASAALASATGAHSAARLSPSQRSPRQTCRTYLRERDSACVAWRCAARRAPPALAAAHTARPQHAQARASARAQDGTGARVFAWHKKWSTRVCPCAKKCTARSVAAVSPMPYTPAPAWRAAALRRRRHARLSRRPLPRCAVAAVVHVLLCRRLCRLALRASKAFFRLAQRHRR